MNVQRVRKGHYSNHGLGREWQWYPDETVITAPDGDRLIVTHQGNDAQVRFYPREGSPLTLRSPYFRTHDELVGHWRARFALFKERIAA